MEGAAGEHPGAREVSAVTPTEVNWSDELEHLHEESSRSHSIDIWTREAMVGCLGPVSENVTVVDLGCSSGYLLEDLRSLLPSARLVGIDLLLSSLRKAQANVPDATVVQADACHLPISDASVDALLSANLLEHVSADQEALIEIRRVLRPGGTAVLVVPASVGTYDYYDRFLHHQRRYDRGDLARKCRSAGLEVIRDFHLCSLIFPVFWVVKKRNRYRFEYLQGAALEERVAKDIANTQDSALFALTCRAERWLLARGLRLPFGIRGLTVVKRPERSS